MIKSLNVELRNFNGSSEFVKHYSGNIMTEGIVFMRKTYGLYWLIDTIGLLMFEIEDHFVSWEFRRNEQTSSFMLIATDGNVSKKPEADDEVKGKIYYERLIPFSDCEYDLLNIWVVDGVMLLPSEY